MKLELVPVTISDAKLFVGAHHRHHPAPVGGVFAVGVASDSEVVGVAIAGRPVGRRLDDGWTLEVTRCCVKDGIPNACSMLYRALWRAARALGYRRVITYTMESESGVSLTAAGFKVVGATAGGTWSRTGRPRVDRHPLQPRLRWECETEYRPGASR